MTTVKYYFQGIVFEWDNQKALSNIKNHQITFEESCEIFFLEDTKIIEDEFAIEDEERFIAIGSKNGIHFLLVAHTYRENEDDENEIIRIISSRKISKGEVKKWLS